MSTENLDPLEINKFSELASRWWDETSDFKPLHAINPLRLQWIKDHCLIENQHVLDIGCGGGILTESMAKAGALAKGIDLSKKALQVAKLHSLETGVQVDYEMIAAEDLAASHPDHFDVVTCMEMLEHVPDPKSVVQACATLAKPGATLFFSTLNRNPKSYLMAILGAEYILKMLPRGTHDYAKFIKPSELSGYIREAGLEIVDMIGLHFNPLTETYWLGSNVDVNYMFCARKPV
jgi:2-polyprenyl-6-hydroxyphenyl methylase / 3-demethylubiquinone-9 3-methyltransferase